MTRQQFNREILKHLTAFNEACGDQRFTQLLVNAGVTLDVSDQTQGWQAPVNTIFYNEESEKTLDRVLQSLDTIYTQMLGGSGAGSEEV